jgi:hypothetical protein
VRVNIATRHIMHWVVLCWALTVGNTAVHVPSVYFGIFLCDQTLIRRGSFRNHIDGDALYHRAKEPRSTELRLLAAIPVVAM